MMLLNSVVSKWKGGPRLKQKDRSTFDMPMQLLQFTDNQHTRTAPVYKFKLNNIFQMEKLQQQQKTTKTTKNTAEQRQRNRTWSRRGVHLQCSYRPKGSYFNCLITCFHLKHRYTLPHIWSVALKMHTATDTHIHWLQPFYAAKLCVSVHVCVRVSACVVWLRFVYVSLVVT